MSFFYRRPRADTQSPWAHVSHARRHHPGIQSLTYVLCPQESNSITAVNLQKSKYLHFGIVKRSWNVIVAAQDAKIKHLHSCFSSLSPVHPRQKQACNLSRPTHTFIVRQRPLVAILHLHNVASRLSARPFIFRCRQSFFIRYIIKPHFPSYILWRWDS